MQPVLAGLGIFAMVLTAACAAGPKFTDGSIFSLEETATLPMRIEVPDRSGFFVQNGRRIMATDPRTGETFSGQYVEMQDRATAVVLAPGGFRPVFGFASSQRFPAVATLHGDQGTVLHCQMVINEGHRRSGGGECTDNRGRRYSLMF